MFLVEHTVMTMNRRVHYWHRVFKRTCYNIYYCILFTFRRAQLISSRVLWDDAVTTLRNDLAVDVLDDANENGTRRRRLSALHLLRVDFFPKHTFSRQRTWIFEFSWFPYKSVTKSDYLYSYFIVTSTVFTVFVNQSFRFSTLDVSSHTSIQLA